MKSKFDVISLYGGRVSRKFSSVVYQRLFFLADHRAKRFERDHLWSTIFEELNFWGISLKLLSYKTDPMDWVQDAYVAQLHSHYDLLRDQPFLARRPFFFVDIGCSVGFSGVSRI